VGKLVGCTGALSFDLHGIFPSSDSGAFPPPVDGEGWISDSTADEASGHAEMTAESVRAIMSISFCFCTASIW
jgi:hypothetical protein